jgi:hypothetical protein
MLLVRDCAVVNKISDICVWGTTLQRNDGKSKAVPATCHGGTRGERRYASYSYLISALDGGEWSASRPGRGLPLLVPIGLEAGVVFLSFRSQKSRCRPKTVLSTHSDDGTSHFTLNILRISYCVIK